jgi:5'-nucleotidase
MLILVTNDDGYHSEGLQQLAAVLAPLGRVVIVAPEVEMSAVSHQLTLHRPLRVRSVSEDTYLVDGTPSDCVYMGSVKILPKKPDMVVSGINRGGNLGDDVTYSGTVAAALEGTILNIPSFAISQLPEDGFDFHHSSTLAHALACRISEQGLPAGVFLNVNVPAGRPGGIEVTRQGRRCYEQSVEERVDPRGRRYFWIGGNEDNLSEQPGTDLDALSRGMITITPLQLDLTSRQGMEAVAGWERQLKFLD